MADRILVRGRGIVDGTATAEVLHLDEPLNVWGGLDPTTGEIIHRQHPQYRQRVAGTVLVLTETRGSGTNTQVIAQTMANGVGPAAVVLAEPDSVLVAGVLAGSELFGRSCPVALVSLEDLGLLPTGARVVVDVTVGVALISNAEWDVGLEGEAGPT